MLSTPSPDRSESATPRSALAGIRVLDLSRILSGPLATMVLADLGPDVVKVENPQAGDHARWWDPPFVATADIGAGMWATIGTLAVAAGNDKLWRLFAETIGCADLADAPRSATNPKRVRRRNQLIPLLEAALQERGRDDWAKLLTAAGVPCAAIATVAEALESPQATARGMVTELEHPTVGRLRTTGSPLKLSATSVDLRTAAPLLGQHTDEVLAETGYSPGQSTEPHTTEAVR